MTKCAVLLLGLLVALLVAPGAVFAQSGGSPMDIYPFCQQGAVSAPCNCNVFDWQDNGYIEPGCYCHENMDFCVNEPGVIVWSHSDYPTNTPTAVSTPEFITATPRSNQEQFDKLPNGCPDWSQLGPGTSTPGPNDVSVDYAMRCRGCLAGSSAGGLNLPTPITGPIAGMRVEVPGAYDWYLASSLDAVHWPNGWELGPGQEARWSADDYPELQGRDVIGVLIEVVRGELLDTCDARYDEIVGPARAWVTGPGLICFGPKWICGELAPGAPHAYSGIATEDMRYGVRLVMGEKGSGLECEDGSVASRFDLILRDHVDSDLPHPPIIGATRTPTPAPTNIPSPTPDVPKYWLGPPMTFSGSYNSETATVGCHSAGPGLRWGVGYQNTLWWSFQVEDIPGELVGVIWETGVVTGDFKRMGIGDSCGAAGYLSPWSNTSDHNQGSNRRVCVADGHLGKNHEEVCGLVAAQNGLAPFDTLLGGFSGKPAGADVSIGFSSQWRSYGVYNMTLWPVYYSVPIYPTATPVPTAAGPTPTPVLGGTPSSLPGGSGYIGDNCDVVEWRSQDEKSGKDVLEWEWSGWTSEPECYVIVPEINETIPLDKIPLLHLDAVDVSWPGFELCVMWIEFPKVTLLGFTVSLDWFLLPLVAGLIGLIIRS